MLLNAGAMKSVRLLAPLIFVGCANEAYTPPARLFPVENASLSGKQDVQMDIANETDGVALGGGANVTNGNARYRLALHPNLAVTADAGLLQVSGDGDATGTAETGRIGAMLHGTAGPVAGGVIVGFGGGRSVYGDWVTPDVGLVINGTHHFVRPALILSAYNSIPFRTRIFDAYSGVDNDYDMRRLPKTLGFQVTLGLEVGPPKLAGVLGLSMSQLYAGGTDVEAAHHDGFVGVGIGVRAAL
jgi:hypothetical protein